VTCVGCHFGHVSGSLDSVSSDAVQGLTNLAPYATVTASSYCVCASNDQAAFLPSHLNDRRDWVPVPAGGPSGPFQDQSTGWISDKGKAVGEWVQLDWTTLMRVSKVHLVGPLPTGGDWDGFNNYHITSGTLHFYATGVEVGAPVNVGQVEPLTNGGTWVTLTTARDIDRVTFVVNSTGGDWYGNTVAALNEIEVSGMAGGVPPPPQYKIFLPLITH
jgi:hypothetical protein